VVSLTGAGVPVHDGATLAIAVFPAGAGCKELAVAHGGAGGALEVFAGVLALHRGHVPAALVVTDDAEAGEFIMSPVAVGLAHHVGAVVHALLVVVALGHVLAVVLAEVSTLIVVEGAFGRTVAGITGEAATLRLAFVSGGLTLHAHECPAVRPHIALGGVTVSHGALGNASHVVFFAVILLGAVDVVLEGVAVRRRRGVGGRSSGSGCSCHGGVGSSGGGVLHSGRGSSRVGHDGGTGLDGGGSRFSSRGGILGEDTNVVVLGSDSDEEEEGNDRCQQNRGKGFHYCILYICL